MWLDGAGDIISGTTNDGKAQSSSCSDFVFVVMNEGRNKVNKNAFEEFCVDYERACSLVYPLWVKRCPDEDNDGTLFQGESKSCKFQKGVVELLQSEEIECDWYFFSPNSYHHQPDVIRKFVSNIDPEEAMVVLSRTQEEMETVTGVALPDPLPEGTTSSDFQYPKGPPIMYSHGAVKRLLPGFEKGSLVNQTLELQVSFEESLRLINWLYSLPALFFPSSTMTSSRIGVAKKRLKGPMGEAPLPAGAGMWLAHGEYRENPLPMTMEYEWHNATGFQASSFFQHRSGENRSWGWQLLQRRDLDRLFGRDPTELDSATQPPSGTDSLEISGDGIAFITFSFLENTRQFDEFIFPSLETWLTEGVYFVVLNGKWKDAFQQMCKNRGRECDRIRPVWVDCDEGYYGPSPCCKAQDGLIRVYEEFPDFDWYVYQDDDMYIRAGYFQGFLERVDASEPVLVCNAPVKQLGESVYRKKYNCSKDAAFRYPWGQPAIYSNGAMKVLLPAFKAKAIEKQCEAFTVTHDTGNQIVHWMHSLPVLRIGIAQNSVEWDRLFGTAYEHADYAMGVHHVGNERSMQDVHHHYTKHASMPRPYRYSWHNVTGFHLTRTYKKYGDPRTWQDEWHTMPVDQCLTDELIG